LSYSSDILALNPGHIWSFDGVFTDSVGSADGTNSGFSATGSPIAEDASASCFSDGVDDVVTLPTTTDINNSSQDRKCIAGWFMTSAVQMPPKVIYREGATTNGFAIVLGWGNNVLFEAHSDTALVQVFSSKVLEPNRAYHLCAILEGSGYATNEFRCFIDGVQQLAAYPASREFGDTSLPARDPGGWGKLSNTAIGRTAVLLNASQNGYYNYWASWSGADAVLTNSEVREVLFEKGVLPEITIASDSPTNMQTALDAYANSSRADKGLNFRVEPPSGIPDLRLEFDAIKFHEKSSCHVQWIGSGYLTLVNKNGSNVSITSTTNSGKIKIIEPQVLTVKCIDSITGNPIEGARVHIYDQASQILDGLTDSVGVASLNYEYSGDVPFNGKVRKASSSPYYKTAQLSGTLTQTPLNTTVLMIKDE
jgi:hypothetical protein